MRKIYDVYGIGNPLIDVLSQVEDTVLASLNIDKGIMTLVNTDRQNIILAAIPEPSVSPGGSCANTIIALADFGAKVIYGGGIGNDHFGDSFEKGIQDLGVVSQLKRKSLPTGSSVILISPDAERSQNTYLGACQQFSIEDIDEEKIKESRLLYFTGYMWDTQSQKDAINYAINVAKKSNTQIYFDVADPFAVNRSKKDFIHLIEGGISFLFANMEEAKSLTGKSDKKEVIDAMMQLTPAGTIKDGGRGSFIFNNGYVIEIPAIKVKAIDSTGAGDVYSAGIIYSMIKGYTLERAGRIASYVAGKLVEQIGARLDYSLKGKIDEI
ncbi:MAG: adenosine kinase [Candidatus Hodarchaeales archaeon]|jgi:sugar/nucleoside kinase (ribokinase family)